VNNLDKLIEGLERKNKQVRIIRRYRSYRGHIHQSVQLVLEKIQQEVNSLLWLTLKVLQKRAQLRADHLTRVEAFISDLNKDFIHFRKQKSSSVSTVILHFDSSLINRCIRIQSGKELEKLSNQNRLIKVASLREHIDHLQKLLLFVHSVCQLVIEEVNGHTGNGRVEL